MHPFYAALGSLAILAIPLGGGDGDGKKGARSLALGQDMSLHVLPARAILSGYTADPLPPFGRALVFGSDREEGPSWDHDFEGSALLLASEGNPYNMDQVISHALRVVGSAVSETFETSAAKIFEMNGKLCVIHDAKTVGRVASAVENLRQVALPRFRFGYILYQGNGAGTTGVLEPAAARALREAVLGGRAGRVLHSGSASARAKDRVFLGRRRRISYLGDHDVEVAQDSSIGDPQVREIDLSKGVGLIALPSPDSNSALVFGQLSFRDLPAGIQTNDLRATKLQQLEHAALTEVQRAFSTKLANGGGLVLAPGGALRPDLRVLITAERLDPAPSSPEGSMVLPVGLLTSETMRGIERPFDGLFGMEGPPIQVDLLIEMVHNLASSDDDGSEIWSAGHALGMRTTKANLDKARDLVGFLAKDLERSFVVEIVHEVKLASAAQAAPWRVHGQPIEIPVLASRVGYGQVGSEESFVGDYDVEIAQEASIADPIISSSFDGTQVLVTVEPADRACDVHLALLDRSRLAMRRLSEPAEGIGTIHLPEEEELSFERKLRMKPGETRSLGEGPARRIEGAMHRTRLSLRLREL